MSFDGTGFVTSGLLQGRQDNFSVTFAKAGPYPYVCLLHSGTMKGTVTVPAKTAARPKTTAQVQAEGAQLFAQHKQAATASLTSVKGQVPAPKVTGANSEYTVFTGASDPSGNDWLRCIGGERLTVTVGDKVTFTWDKNAPGVPHTVTFPGGPIPQVILIDAQPNAAPVLYVNPEILNPTPVPPQPPYAGTGLYNSGFIITGGPMAQSYTISFGKAGSYNYTCVLHDSSGMNGALTVR